jgi:hypothetical protein
VQSVSRRATQQLVNAQRLGLCANTSGSEPFAVAVACCASPVHRTSEREVLCSQRDAQAAQLQARLQEELLAQKAALEAQQATQQAQVDKERAVVRGLQPARQQLGNGSQGLAQLTDQVCWA